MGQIVAPAVIPHAPDTLPVAITAGDAAAAYTVSWDETALHVSAYSLKALAEAALPLMKEAGGAIVGLDHYGASAPGATIFEHFGFTLERVTEVGRRVVHDGVHGRIPTLEGGHLPAIGPDGRPSVRDGVQQHGSTDRGGDARVARTSGSDPGHS